MSAPAELSLERLPSPREAALWAGAAALVVVAHAGLYAAYGWLAPRDLPVAAAEAMMIELAPLAISPPEVVESEFAQESPPAERLMAEQDHAEPETAEQAEEAETPESSEVPPDEAGPPEEVTETETVEEEPVEQIASAEPPESVDEVEETVETTESETVEEMAEAAPDPVDPDLLAPETEFPVTPEVPMVRPEPAPRVEPVERVTKIDKPRKVEKKPDAPPKPKAAPKPKKPVEKTVKTEPPKVEKKQDAPPKPKKQGGKKRTTEQAEGGRGKDKADAPKSKPKAGDLDRWRSAVQAALSRRASRARGMGSMRGKVVIAFTVSNSGAIVSVRVTGSSGNAKLDQAVVGMVRSARVPPPPDGERRVVTVPVTVR